MLPHTERILKSFQIGIQHAASTGITGLAIDLFVVALPVLVLATISNWNWLRGPISRYVHDTTGRALLLQGDLKVHLGWSHTRIQAAGVAFSNPPWGCRTAAPTSARCMT